jgi:peptidoglycan hydrolase-like protein with peptidoglycan-binding domain
MSNPFQFEAGPFVPELPLGGNTPVTGRWYRRGRNVVLVLADSGQRGSRELQELTLARSGAAARVAAQARAVASKALPVRTVTGMSPEKACWVQSILSKAEGENLPIDGIYGPRTRDAVRRFQARYQLPVDGIVGPKTETALAQTGLNAIAQASLVPVNGVMDTKTRQQIIAFQSSNGLPADGVVGPKTRAAMVTAVGAQCAVPAPSPRPSPGQGWVQARPSAQIPTGCDSQRLELLLVQCRNDALQGGIGCLSQFGIGISESAEILMPLIDLALATAEIPVIDVITAAIAVFGAAFLTTTQILQAGGCIENVLGNLISCREAARFSTGC